MLFPGIAKGSSLLVNFSSLGMSVGMILVALVLSWCGVRVIFLSSLGCSSISYQSVIAKGLSLLLVNFSSLGMSASMTVVALVLSWFGV